MESLEVKGLWCINDMTKSYIEGWELSRFFCGLWCICLIRVSRCFVVAQLGHTKTWEILPLMTENSGTWSKTTRSGMRVIRHTSATCNIVLITFALRDGDFSESTREANTRDKSWTCFVAMSMLGAWPGLVQLMWWSSVNLILLEIGKLEIVWTVRILVIIENTKLLGNVLWGVIGDNEWAFSGYTKWTLWTKSLRALRWFNGIVARSRLSLFIAPVFDCFLFWRGANYHFYGLSGFFHVHSRGDWLLIIFFVVFV